MPIRLTLKKIRYVAAALLLLLIGAGAGYFLGTREVSINPNNGPKYRIVNRLAPSGFEDIDFSLFWDVWDQVHKTYLKPEEINDKQLVYGAMKGMVSAIGDPYTVFLPPDDNEKVREDLSGQFEGVGMQLGFIDGQLAVMSPLEGMPAMRAGIQAGDYVLNIKDEQKNLDVDTIDMSLQEAVNNIRGPRGTPVILSLYREGRGEFEVTVTRDTITIPSVELEIGEWQSDNWTESPTGTVAWLKVLNFGELTGDQWETAVNKILQNNQIKGVVLDVRNNGGGFFQVAIDLASEFVPQGTVVVQQKDRAKVETYSTQRSGSLVDVPLVVLVNKGTASASEILAGALRDKAGAKIVGVQSFGKGTVQDALELRGDTGLHITIAEWLLPNGDSIQEVGLTPDIEVPIDLNQSEAETTEETAVIDVQLKTAVQQLINL